MPFQFQIPFISTYFKSITVAVMSIMVVYILISYFSRNKVESFTEMFLGAFLVLYLHNNAITKEKTIDGGNALISNEAYSGLIRATNGGFDTYVHNNTNNNIELF
jgi:hypothetical protein